MTTSKLHARVLAAASPILGSCMTYIKVASMAADFARNTAEAVVTFSKDPSHDIAIAHAVAAVLPIHDDDMVYFIRRAAQAVSLMDTDIRVISVRIMQS